MSVWYSNNLGSNPATPANQIANLNDRIMAIVWLNYNIIRVFSSILYLHKKRKHTAKLVQVLYLLSETLKIVSKGHIYAFLLKTEVLLAQLVEHYTFNVGVTSSSLVGDTFLIVMGLYFGFDFIWVGMKTCSRET